MDKEQVKEIIKEMIRDGELYFSVDLEEDYAYDGVEIYPTITIMSGNEELVEQKGTGFYKKYD
jgi:hypothetical protein